MALSKRRRSAPQPHPASSLKQAAFAEKTTQMSFANGCYKAYQGAGTEAHGQMTEAPQGRSRHPPGGDGGYGRRTADADRLPDFGGVHQNGRTVMELRRALPRLSRWAAPTD